MSEHRNCHDCCTYGKKCTVPQGEYFDLDNCRENYETYRKWAEKKKEEPNDD